MERGRAPPVVRRGARGPLLALKIVNPNVNFVYLLPLKVVPPNQLLSVMRMSSPCYSLSDQLWSARGQESPGRIAGRPRELYNKHSFDKIA